MFAGSAERVYAHLGLPLDAATMAHIDAGKDENVWGDLSGSSDETARRWEGRLADDHLALVADELARTPMADWWSA